MMTFMAIRMPHPSSYPAYGPIADMAFALGDRYAPEPVAATSAGSLGGLTLFQRDLPLKIKRKLHAIGGAWGMWSLPSKQSVKVNGVSVEKPSADPHQTDNGTLILATDANPSPGSSRITTKTARGDINITTRMQISTVGAALFFQRTAVLHVITNDIGVLEPYGTSRKKIQDVCGNWLRDKIRACSICDPRKDMFPMGDKQNHPFKLAVLAKDIRRVALANVDADEWNLLADMAPGPGQSLTYNTLLIPPLRSSRNTVASLIALIKCFHQRYTLLALSFWLYHRSSPAGTSCSTAAAPISATTN
ncbi:hypothetical protein FIBSPDRAFT_961877 [Athelia psychrophila]|uniref:Uncharacterized protein n=1 Tax=Athelia psychrophila TaxID=1759441 RepID=A0A166ATJ3_9AGAM|nr:hypothetical protein FIBSPDRAFT_961877 [Fibularhizoctonia sp. CBS 109695]